MGGAGRHRGGLGIELVVRARSPVTFNCQIDRAHCKPWELEGGLEASGNEVMLKLNDVWQTDFPNAKVFLANLKPGDGYRIRSGGGGGYGLPWERPVEECRRTCARAMREARPWPSFMAPSSIPSPSRSIPPPRNGAAPPSAPPRRRPVRVNANLAIPRGFAIFIGRSGSRLL